MQHKYDVNLKYIFNIVIMAAGLHFEKFKVSPAVDNEKLVFLGTPGLPLIWIRIKPPSATPDHLPELDVGVNRLCKDQIDYLMDIYSRV